DPAHQRGILGDVDADAERMQALAGGLDVPTPAESLHARYTVGERVEQQRAVGERLVAGDAQLPAQRASAADARPARRLGRGDRHAGTMAVGAGSERPTAAMIGSSARIMSSKPSSVSDCGPSESACSGWG